MINEIPDILEIRNLTKEFRNVKSLDNINISVKKAEIYSIVGIKGAGKSTLVKILGGYFSSETYSGEIIINGKIEKFSCPKDSERAGLSIAFQDQGLIEELSIFENIFLGNELTTFGIVDWKKECDKADKLLKDICLNVNPGLKLSTLSHGEQQLVKIAKAISKKANILIFDDPADGLTECELENFVKTLKKLKYEGITCIYLSHELNEVLNFSDRITVLKDGKIICTEKNEDLDEEWVLTNMSGRKLERIKPLDVFLRERGITEREKEIILSLIQGYGNKEISDKLFISINTVKTHIANIYQKMNVSQRMDLANIFRRLNYFL